MASLLMASLATRPPLSFFLLLLTISGLILEVPRYLFSFSHSLCSHQKGKKPVPEGLLYKVYIPVHADRTIEVTGSLFAANGTLLHEFPARLKGILLI